MEYFIAILLVIAIIYCTWEILLMLLLLYGIGLIAKRLYKSSRTHAVLYMYLWIVYGGFAFLLLCLPITHARWFKGESTWLERLYNTEFLSKIESDCDKYITYILDNKLNDSKACPSSEKYKLYNRIASRESENLYLDFHVGMLANEFYDLNKNEYDDYYPSYSYLYNQNTEFKKYELLDGVDFSLDGIFVNKRLQGIVFHDVGTSSLDGRYKAEELSKTIKKKFGEPIEVSKDSTDYVAKWLFDDKHIIVVSMQELIKEEDTYYSYDDKEQRFTGIIIYNPHSIIPFIEQEVLKRKEADKVAKEQEKRRQEQERKELLRQQEERKTARQQEIADSISAAKKKNNIQNGF